MFFRGLSNVNTTRRYFSQNGEDFLLWQLFGHKKNGFYVDVGAFDGVHLSNTFSFDREGWSGICIEPHPFYFQLCQRMRPQATNLNLACVADEGITSTRFYVDDIGLLSGIRRDRTDDVRSRYEKRGLDFKDFQEITVCTSTLNAILRCYLPPRTEIDFMSIDVEGTELEVLRGLDLSRFRPRAFIVEANSDKARDALYGYLVEVNGYVEARRLVENVFYTRNRADARLLQRISLDCRIEKSFHPLGPQYTPQPYMQGRVIREQAMRRRGLARFLKRVFMVGA